MSWQQFALFLLYQHLQLLDLNRQLVERLKQSDALIEKQQEVLLLADRTIDLLRGGRE